MMWERNSKGHSNNHPLFGEFLYITKDFQAENCWNALNFCNNLLAQKSLVTYNILARASLVAQLVKNPPAMWETWVWSLGWEDPLEEGMATHSSILAWRIAMDRGTYQAIVFGVTKSRT